MRLACTIGLFTVAVSMGCKRRNEPAPPPPPAAVLTSTVHAQPEPVLSRRGVVAAGTRLRLGFNTPGIISAIKVRTGEKVRKDQVLARLRDNDAAAALDAAQVNQVRAQRNLTTADVLSASGSIAVDVRDQARTALQVADAHASLAAESLAQRKIVAPIAGTVLQRLAEPGEAVAPGVPVLVIESTDYLVAKVGVTERELVRVRINQPATLFVDGTEAGIPGVVTSIAPSPGADGLYAAEVTPAKVKALPFRSGSLLTVHFQEEAKAPSVRIPLDAMVYRDDKNWVFVVTGSPREERARLRELTIDRAEGKDVLVRTGLKEGERIVREGGQFLQDGEPVRLLD